MQKHHRILLLVSTGVFMSTMDSSMVNVALPTLMKIFSSSLAVTEWVVLIYLLTITVTLLFWGNLSTKTGQGRLYGWGILLFVAGSLSCSLAGSIEFLIGSRFCQAIGASMMMAMGPALINSTYPKAQLGQGLGMVGVATSLGLMSGPAVGGLLLRWSHWRFIFLVTVPIGLLVYLRFRRILSSVDGSVLPARPNAGGRFDVTGGILYASAVALSVLLLTHTGGSCRSPARGDWLSYFFFAVPILWLFFIIYESKKERSLLPVHLFRNRFYAMAMLSAMLSFVVLFFVLLLMPFYLSSVRGYPPDRVGFFMMAMPLCVFFVAPLAGRLHDKIGARIVASIGLGGCFVSLLLLTGITVGSSPVFIVFTLALLGFGQAMFLAPNSAAALAGVAHDDSGVTSSLLATSRNMGMLLGTALAGYIFAQMYGELTGGMDIKDFSPAQTGQFMQALRQTFVAGSFIAGMAVLSSWLRGSPRRVETD